MTTSTHTGLRARKKAKTRAAIRGHAMRLFDERGYAATTVEQIAAAAEVSPSTFFRYFPTKEDVVLIDDYDPIMVAEMKAVPAGVPPIEAIRRVLLNLYENISDEDWQLERARQKIMLEAPELRARALQQYLSTIDMLAAAVAERAGLPADDFSARVLSGAVIGTALAAMPHGMTAMAERTDMHVVGDALRLLQDGLPLGPATPRQSISG